MCSRCAGTRPGPGPVDFGPDQMCRHTDKTPFLVVPEHFASPDLPAHCAGTVSYTHLTLPTIYSV